MPIERLCCLLLGAAIVVRLFVTGMPAPFGAPQDSLAAALWDRLAHAGAYALVGALFVVGLKPRKDPVCVESLER